MKVLILVTDTGGGHQRASMALKETIEKDKNNTVKIEDALMYSSKFLHWVVSGLYMFFATKTPKFYGKVYNSADKVSFLDKCVHGISSFYSRKLQKLINNYKPDCIISCHAFCGDMISSIKKKGGTNALTITIITDFSAHSTYIRDNTDAYVVSNDDMVQELREKYNVDASIIYPLGIPVYEKFYEILDPIPLRENFGLNPYKKTVLMMAGSFGVTDILEIYANINKYPSDYQVIVITGRNEKLFQKFQDAVKNGYIKDKKGNNIKITLPTKLCFFVDDIEKYMSASDIIVTKPGGLTVSESLAKELPMAVFASYGGQEEDNINYLKRHHLAVILKDGQECANQINNLISNTTKLTSMKNNIKTFKKNHSAENIYRLIKEKL